MDLTSHQQWIDAFYKKRGWNDYSSAVGLNFLMEESGELARAVRAIEIGRDHPGEANRTQTELRENLVEELGDVLDQVLFCANKYDIDAMDLLAASEAKLTERFQD